VTSPESPDATRTIDLAISGMTCASCANRIEKKLNRLEGVEASVNYATERASVDVAADVDPEVLVQTVESIGYHASLPAEAHDHPDGHDHDTGEDLSRARQRVIVSAVLSVPVVALAMIPALQFDNWQWLSLTLTAPVVVWGGYPFHRAAWLNLRHGAATMDTLVSIGTLAAFGYSLWSLFFGSAGDPGMRMTFHFTLERGSGEGEIYLEAAAAVTTFILAGRYFEVRAKRRTSAALRALLDLGAKDVALLRDGHEVRVPIEQLVVGDDFVVRPGEKVATDGVVVEGTSAIDASLLTGEGVPVEVGPGDGVTGATINAGGRLVVRATRVGADTQLARIGQLVEQAQAGKADVQRLADRISGVFVPAVIVLASATLGFWLGVDAGRGAAFTAAVAVLIIACPCALGLATPMALMVGTGRGAQLGILIRGPEVLESTRAVDTIVLDKTGTVTTGEMTLIDIVTTPGVDRADALRIVGSLEAASEHPIARAIADAAVVEGALAAVDDFQSTRGLGAEGCIDGVRVVVGRASHLAALGFEIDAASDDARRAAEAAGRTAVVAGWDAKVRAVFVVADAIKPSAAPAVSSLRELDLTPILLTGDNAAAANEVARAVGIDTVIAEVLPEEKVETIARLQREGGTVAMVGDGVNDAAALATADLGLSMGTGSDAAIEASDLTLVRGDLRSVPDAIRLARRTLAVIKGNLFWAFAYNVAALPLAMAGFLNPMIAGAAMAFSSVFVVTNSLRLRRFTPSH